VAAESRGVDADVGGVADQVAHQQVALTTKEQG
jgi:hypothetical protein